MLELQKFKKCFLRGIVISSVISITLSWAALRPNTIAGLDLIQGSQLSYDLSKSENTVLVFLSAKCPCSNSHIPKLKELEREFKKDGFAFLGIHSNSNEDVKISTEYFKNLKLPFPVIQDSDAKIADQFKAFKTPHVFVLNKKNEILFQGGVDDSKDAARAKKNFLELALLKIRNKETPPVKEARVLGCEIKRP